jgi:hypothetical protein
MKNRDARRKVKMTEEEKQEALREFALMFDPMRGFGWATVAMAMMEFEKGINSRGTCDAHH